MSYIPIKITKKKTYHNLETMHGRGQLSEDPSVKHSGTIVRYRNESRTGSRSSTTSPSDGRILPIYLYPFHAVAYGASVCRGRSLSDETEQKIIYHSSNDDIQCSHARDITYVSGRPEWCVMCPERVIWTNEFDPCLFGPRGSTH